MILSAPSRVNAFGRQILCTVRVDACVRDSEGRGVDSRFASPSQDGRGGKGAFHRDDAIGGGAAACHALAAHVPGCRSSARKPRRHRSRSRASPLVAALRAPGVIDANEPPGEERRDRDRRRRLLGLASVRVLKCVRAAQWALADVRASMGFTSRLLFGSAVARRILHWLG